MNIKRFTSLLICCVAALLLNTPSADAQLLENILGEVVNQAINGQRNNNNNNNNNNSGQNRSQSVPGESGRGNQGQYQPGSWVPGESGRRNQGGFQGGSQWQQVPRNQPRQNYQYQRTQQTYVEPPVLQVVSNGQPIEIHFRKTQSGTCDFTLIGGTREFPRTLKPGQMQPLKGSSTVWQVRYYGKGGSKTYRVRGGSKYVFLRDDQGFIQLYKEPKNIVTLEPPVLAE